MLVSRWIIAVAFGLALATSGQAQEQTDSPGGQADQEHGPITPDIPRPFPVQIVEDDSATDARQRSEEEARQREISDLAAQEGMNAATQAMNGATQRMAEYAFWSTVFVAIGTVLLVITLVLTWMANRSAQTAVTVTREIGRKQVRAYVLISEIDLSELPKRQTAVIANVGSSPAMKFRTIYEFCEADAMDWAAMAEDAKTASHIGISPSQSIHMSINIPDGIVDNAVCGIYVIYEDVFGDIHEERWVLRRNEAPNSIGYTRFESGEQKRKE